MCVKGRREQLYFRGGNSINLHPVCENVQTGRDTGLSGSSGEQL